ncbi:hypothetical protein D0T49_12790 [Paludibacter sp. 221]|uniref:hypothetical protein n=1 Tax=Paludibacter sp. 221 TaxID=2302939 RepID=UPI0013D635C5|nr:hypothetical protein [Paludibacter sp. 221]NDV47922.1 hypothetical protein [Paludibacter sp. 221]
MKVDVEKIIRENAYRNAEKKKDYDPVSGLNCDGERFVLTVEDKNPRTFYLPIEMSNFKAIRLLKKYGSIAALLKMQLRATPTQEQIDYFWLKLCEERYKYDFEFFAISCITIEDKQSAETIRFKLNPAQRMLLAVFEKQRKEGIQIQAQVLKAKQMGFSTLTQMYMKWIQIIHKKNWNSVVCAHVRDAAINVRSMYERSVKVMPAIEGVKFSMKSFALTQNIKEIPERGCRITVGFATEPESVRSQNVKMVHFSEEAFYPATEGNNPELLESSIISSSTKGAYTMIVRESTANGVGDYFYEQWQKAKKQETSFEAVFAPWFMIPLYEEIFDGYYYQHNGRKKKGTISEFISTFNEYEQNLWNNYKLCTLENLNWRRMMAATMPSESKMKQEFPSNDIEAFQDSGSPVFKSEDVEKLRAGCCPPVAVGDMISSCSPQIAIVEPERRKEILKNVRFLKDNEATDFVLNGDQKIRFIKGVNKLHIWEYPDTEQKISNRYVVVFDPQKGTSEGADYGVIKVFDRYWMKYGEKPQVVALFYGHIDKDITIWIAAQIARYYNDALLVIESNTYDSTDRSGDETEFIFDTIAEYYDNLYSRTSAEKIREGAPIKYGFQTNKNTKPMIISHYIAILRESGYIERDEETLNEARTYEKKKDGSYGAKAKKHDDRIMATMIGLYVCYQLPTPAVIKNAPETSTIRRTAW